jgi:hypothetical protein
MKKKFFACQQKSTFSLKFDFWSNVESLSISDLKIKTLMLSTMHKMVESIYGRKHKCFYF